MAEGCVEMGFQSADDLNNCFNTITTLRAVDNINIGDKVCGTLSADTRFDIDSFAFTTVGGRDLEVTLNVLDNSFDIQVDFDKVDDADSCTSTLTFDRLTSSGGSLVFQPEKVIIGAPNEPLDAGTYRITVAPVNGDSLDLPCSSGSSSGPLGYELLVTDVTTTTTTTTEVPFVFACPSGSVNEQEACVTCTTLAQSGICLTSTEANAGCSLQPTPQTPTYESYTIGTTLCGSLNIYNQVTSVDVESDNDFYLFNVGTSGTYLVELTVDKSLSSAPAAQAFISSSTNFTDCAVDSTSISKFAQSNDENSLEFKVTLDSSVDYVLKVDLPFVGTDAVGCANQLNYFVKITEVMVE